MSGSDVQQLNANLVALGYTAGWTLDPASDDFNWVTKQALMRMQKALGVKATGTLELGAAVFLPRALRITKLATSLGAQLARGAAVAQASSTVRRVAVSLTATQRASVRVGDRVGIALPNGRTTRGVVTSVGKVASGAKIRAAIELRRPAQARGMDQAPVQVAITTAKAKRALVVPVNALLARAGGSYAVETVDRRGARHLVPVTLGLFDDAESLVQVTGTRLRGGDRIVVPGS